MVINSNINILVQMELLVCSNKINRDFSLLIEKFHNNSISCQNSFGLSLNNNGLLLFAKRMCSNRILKFFPDGWNYGSIFLHFGGILKLVYVRIQKFKFSMVVLYLDIVKTTDYEKFKFVFVLIVILFLQGLHFNWLKRTLE